MKAKFLLCAVSLSLSVSLGAQEVASLRSPATPTGGYAELFGGYESGGFHSGYDAASLWKVGAKAEGTHRGRHVTWNGRFGFEHFSGENMLTSMFIHPGYYPIDVLEFTPGNKTRQTYSFGGSMLAGLGERWLLGGKMSYEAINYAKRKDIRHTTYGMDFSIEPTVGVKLSDGKAILSMSYIFRKTAETIDAEQVGTATDESYYAFLDKGMRYGAYQVWDGDGIHLDEAGVGLLPVKEYSHGFSIVILSRPVSNHAELLFKQGIVGEKGYTWFRFPGYAIRDRLSGSHNAPAFTGSWELEYRLDSDRLEESVLDKVTDGGVTTPVVYAFNGVSDRAHHQMKGTYGMHFRSGAVRLLQAEVSYAKWLEASYLFYPYRDALDINFGLAGIKAGFEAWRFLIDADVWAGWGGKTEKGLGEVLGDAPVQPYRLQGDWDRKMEYLTATRCGVSMGLTYRFQSVRGLRITADGSWQHGFNLTVLPGSERFTAGLRLGYEFSQKQ